ncbi:hypothetical protein CDD83_3365 [Cordyceps sp. RAO-2017]|nr:hypothetical protein CDD83_3365 [Cordyceps sp. RAO-2017]
MSGFLATLVAFVGLYLVSLLSFDARKSAESSRFNVHQKRPSEKRAAPGSGNGAARPAQRPTFRTLADLGSD